MKKYLRGGLVAGLSLAVIAGLTSSALASLTITPTLLVIEGRERYADVNLINNSDKPQSYAIGWRFFRQSELEGNYLTSEKSITDFDLTQNLVFTPKRVRLAPDDLQKIRLGLRLKGEPPAPGDYRAHLELKESAENAAPGQSQGQGRTSVGVKINVGFSIPVIYRVGAPDVQGVIGDVKTQINPNTKQIELVVPMSRKPATSKFGLLGHFRVYLGDTLIGEQKNANVFPEIETRVFKIPLKTMALNSGSVRIVYSDYKFDGNEKAVLTEKTMTIK